MLENNDFLSQTGEVENLKKTRVSKKKAEVTEESPELVIVNHDNITQELTKANITDQVLRELAEYKKLTVNGLEDKEGYEKVKNAQTLCRNTRVLAEKICKKGRESAIAEQRAWIAKEKEVSEQIESVETYLKAQREIIDGEKARQVAERENHMKTRMQERTTILLGFGMVFDGATFVLQEGEEKLSIDALDVKLSDDIQFNILSLKAEIIHEKSKIRIQQEQESARIEAERVAKIKTEQEAEAARLTKQAEELRLQQEAIDKQKRILEIEEEKRVASAKAVEEAQKKAEIEKQEALLIAENKRLADIARLEKAAADKVIADAKAAQDKVDAEKRAEDARIAAETAKKATEARAHALLPDKNKLVEFAVFVEEICLPEVKSEAAIAIVNTIKESLAKLSAWTIKQSETLT